MSIKLEIPNNPACLHAARTFFDVLLGEAGESTMLNAADGHCVIEPSEQNTSPTPDQEQNTSPTPDQEADEWPQERNGVLYDKAGLPWDERIHAGTKTCKKDGTWKYLRGVQPITVEEVEAELKKAVAATPPPVQNPPVQNPPVQNPPVQNPPVQNPITTFPDLMVALSPKINDGSLTMEMANEVCNKYDIGSVALLATNPAMIPVIAAELGV